MALKQKWKIYIITLFSYALTHSIRTLWASIKSNLTIPPFNYNVGFLGTLDMMVLFIIGLLMNIFGHRVSQFGAKKCLVIVLSLVLIFSVMIGLFLYFDLTYIGLYIVFYGFGFGISSFMAWPACLYMVSFYFNQNDRIYLSLWNGCSQLGEFIALITYFAISNTNQMPPQASFFIQAGYIVILLLCVIYYIPVKLVQEETDNPIQAHKNTIIAQKAQDKAQYVEIQQQIMKQKEDEEDRKTVQGQIVSEVKGERVEKASQDQRQQKINTEDKIRGQGQSQVKTEQNNGSQNGLSNKQFQSNGQHRSGVKRVNILTVWYLPGVAFVTLALGLTKSVNAIIVSWMVFYLLSIDLGSEAIIITILWSVCIILGGLICGFINKTLSYVFFACQLFGAAICFIFLQEFHRSIFQGQIFFSVIICALFYGGPYNLLNTVVPISLANQKQVRQYENGKTAVISLTESFALLCCGISLLIVPPLGIHNMHIVCCVYCLAAALLLLGQHYRLYKQQKFNLLRQKLKPHQDHNKIIQIK